MLCAKFDAYPENPVLQAAALTRLMRGLSELLGCGPLCSASPPSAWLLGNTIEQACR